MMSEKSLLITIDDKLGEKINEYSIQKKLHENNEKKLKFIYYFLGGISVILSSVVSFLTGVYTFNSKNLIITISLIFSLSVTIINTILNFSQIEQKISKHHDASLQYGSLLLDIDEYLLNNKDIANAEKFYAILLEKQKIISSYLINSFCFK